MIFYTVALVIAWSRRSRVLGLARVSTVRRTPESRRTKYTCMRQYQILLFLLLLFQYRVNDIIISYAPEMTRVLRFRTGSRKYRNRINIVYHTRCAAQTVDRRLFVFVGSTNRIYNIMHNIIIIIIIIICTQTGSNSFSSVTTMCSCCTHRAHYIYYIRADAGIVAKVSTRALTHASTHRRALYILYV